MLHEPGDLLGWSEPPWRIPILFSKLVRGEEPNAAKLPNLVVCAAVNVSDDVVPPGRLASSFTFERDFAGGPLTGYEATSRLEDAAGWGVLTLPAMMAISGAAISPSMGKMTRPWARFLLALFNARLGVWLPNPLRIGDFGARTSTNRPLTTRQVALDWRERNPRFPADPTTNQWFDDRQFESYRALGAFAARKVVCAFRELERSEKAKQRVLDQCKLVRMMRHW
jgi:hypothetical protein